MKRFLVAGVLVFAVAFGIFISQATAQNDTAPEPLSESKILTGLKGDITPKRLGVLVGRLGVDFSLTPEIERRLRAAGANDELIAAIRNAKVTLKQDVSLILDADADCTVTVDGNSFDMRAGEEKTVSGVIGDNIVRAVSKRDTTVVWRKVVHAESAEQKAVLIELQSQLQSNTVNNTNNTNNNTNNSNRQAGTTRTNARDGQTYVWAPAGTYQMGCSPGDSECRDDEKPAHRITISRGFWIGQTLVTQAAYQRVTGKNPSWFHGDRLPVEMVTAADARAYCTSLGMRLPTEAEWEYAARAGNSSGRFGDLDSIAWYGDNAGDQRIRAIDYWNSDQTNYGKRLDANKNRTHPVAEKRPNAWKLYDILGNSLEWTADWYSATYYGQSPSQDPPGPNSGRMRALRGGSWYSFASDVRVSSRTVSDPNAKTANNSFRCVGETLP